MERRASSRLRTMKGPVFFLFPLRQLYSGPAKGNRLRMLPPLVVTCISSDGVGKSARITVKAAALTIQWGGGAAMSVLGGKAEDICSYGGFRLVTRRAYASHPT